MKGPIAAGLLALISTVYAQTSRRCQNDICYTLNIPASTASSGNGDIFFQLSAPTSNRWVALGQGTQMAGAQIFVMYTSGDGNVTVSPRLGRGHVMPNFNSAASITLLEGSGVDGDTMIANVRCSSCNSWSGGSADFTSESSANDWIFAWQSGSAINSNSESATITQHDEMGQISFDYSAAQGGNSANPLLSTSSGSSGNSGNSGSDTGSGNSGDTGGITTTSGPRYSLLVAHGVLGSLVFVIFLPLGGIVIRLLSFQNLVWVHAGIQIFSYMMLIAAVGLGIYIANDLNELDKYHPVIGLVLFCLVSLQPILGTLHHSAFAKYQRRTILSYVHIWLGRIVITLGMIQGGLGLLLADNSRAGNIAYGVVAGVIWVVYVASAVFGELRRGRTTASGASTPPKYGDVPPVQQTPVTNGGSHPV